MTKRILIVDDDQDIRDVVQVSLEDFAGWQTLTAASGSEGLQILETELLDAILADLSMPDMDGVQFFEQLQAKPDINPVPVIFLTAKASVSDRHRLKEMGAVGIIAKPFDPATIWQQIAQILNW
ncbi:MAG TPA: response regulator [Crinalium sp.]|jgi:CheY-like chemotaxis protein